MGQKYARWSGRTTVIPANLDEMTTLIKGNRAFEEVTQLTYGDHGLESVMAAVLDAIRSQKKIALYADYDVDGTMSCVSWIWFFRAIGFTNFVHYIPCRFKEGYGVNRKAVEFLVAQEKADVIITMDTGITANEEAAYCHDHGVTFICTDHHKIQPEKMPHCLILNPKMHPNHEYQELCGAGITFVLLRKLGIACGLDSKSPIWTDLVALAGMATICDVVPLNPVNHRLAKLGVDALKRSQRPILRKLLAASSAETADEQDVGFRIGPRINAVGRLNHADRVVHAFVTEEADELIRYMSQCNDERKKIQASIVQDATAQVLSQGTGRIVFLGGPWHQGVVGIAAAKIAQEFWRPTWLFEVKDGLCKGSARSIKGFDVTDAMASCKDLFIKFGGHAAAGGFLFHIENMQAIKSALVDHANRVHKESPRLWESELTYDFNLPPRLLSLELVEAIECLKPFGHGFEEPRFALTAPIIHLRHLCDRATGVAKHTSVEIEGARGLVKLMFFGEVILDLKTGDCATFIVNVKRNVFRGVHSLQLTALDYEKST